MFLELKFNSSVNEILSGKDGWADLVKGGGESGKTVLFFVA
mgnify:CR=1 FL=1